MTQPYGGLSAAGSHFAVIGAGVVGCCCALSLLQAGHRVTLIDRGPPGSGCSFGNGGLIQVGACVPLATPEMLKDVPRMLFDSQSPLVVRRSDLRSLAPFFVQFARSSRRVEPISALLASALRSAVSSYRALLGPAEFGELIRQSGELYVYETEEAYRKSAWAHALRSRLGVRVEHCTGDEARELEPALGRSVTRGVWLPETYLTIDPFGLVNAVCARFVSGGGTILRSEAKEIHVSGDGGVAVNSATGRIMADGVVVAAAVGSKRFAEQLGLEVPLQAERGYHVMFGGPSPLSTPIVSSAPRMGIVPLAGGTRLVSGSEFTRESAPADFRRIREMQRHARRLVPTLGEARHEAWMGARPSMPDGLPVVMKSKESARVLFAFGHGHLGLTLAAHTGSLIRDLASSAASSPGSTPFEWPRSFA